MNKKKKKKKKKKGRQEVSRNIVLHSWIFCYTHFVLFKVKISFARKAILSVYILKELKPLILSVISKLWQLLE